VQIVSEKGKGNELIKILKYSSTGWIQNIETLWETERTETDRSKRIGQLVRTVRAVVQHAEIHIRPTMLVSKYKVTRPKW